MEYDSRGTEKFIDYCAYRKNLSGKTITAYAQDLKTYAAYMQSHPESDVEDYVSHLLKSGRKPATVKRHIATLKQYYKYICKAGKTANPMLALEFKIKSEKLLPRTITVRDVKKLLETAAKAKDCARTSFETFQTTRDMALIDLLCATGIRIGEAAAITFDDIDLRSRLILIHGKGKKERLIYLSCKQTVDNLKDWIAMRKTFCTQHGYLFVNRGNMPLSIHGIEDIFGKYRNAAGINPQATPHYLRHTFATNLLANGADLRAVQEILGHSCISVTERYTEVTPGRKIKVLEKYNFRNGL